MNSLHHGCLVHDLLGLGSCRMYAQLGPHGEPGIIQIDRRLEGVSRGLWGRLRVTQLLLAVHLRQRDRMAGCRVEVGMDLVEPEGVQMCLPRPQGLNV